MLCDEIGNLGRLEALLMATTLLRAGGLPCGRSGTTRLSSRFMARKQTRSSTMRALSRSLESATTGWRRTLQMSSEGFPLMLKYDSGGLWIGIVPDLPQEASHSAQKNEDRRPYSCSRH